MRPSKRDKIVDTALELFYEHGFHATGIEKVLSGADVARMTLYNHFKSKEELIVAVLRQRDENFRDWVVRYVEQNGKTPRDRLLALFDAHADWFAVNGVAVAGKFGGRVDEQASAESFLREPIGVGIEQGQ